MDIKEIPLTDQIAKDFSGWDEAGDMDIQLYDATLVVDTPKFKKGDKVKCITFMYSKSHCVITDEEGEQLDIFPLILSVGPIT